MVRVHADGEYGCGGSDREAVGHRHRKYSQIQGYRPIVPRGEYPLVDKFFPLIFKQLKLAGNFIFDMEIKIIYLCLPYILTQ